MILRLFPVLSFIISFVVLHAPMTFANPIAHDTSRAEEILHQIQQRLDWLNGLETTDEDKAQKLQNCLSGFRAGLTEISSGTSSIAHQLEDAIDVVEATDRYLSEGDDVFGLLGIGFLYGAVDELLTTLTRNGLLSD